MPPPGPDGSASGPPALLLAGVDRAAFATGLVVRLRSRGVPVGQTGTVNLVRALVAAPPDSLSTLYWTARISLVHRQVDIEAFDAVFAAVFGAAVFGLDLYARREARPHPPGPGDDAFATLPAAVDRQPPDAGLPWATLPPAVAGADDAAGEFAVPLRLPTDRRGLADVPFEHLDRAEAEMLGAWLAEAVSDWPTRRSRRRRIDARGPRVGLRATMARARRTGWEPVDLVRMREIDKPRRAVMLCDVSQSMQAQAAAYLHLMRALALVADAEVFAFATGLTRLTTVLAHRDARVAVEQAGAKVGDRFGGTRIATSVRALLDSHHGGATRGAVVIIASDGWDSDPPVDLAAAMARLRRRAYRVVWLNPRAGAPGFEPRVAAMAAALPFCDLLLPAHTFGSLRQAITEIARIR